jgi:hypothetical protein
VPVDQEQSTEQKYCSQFWNCEQTSVSTRPEQMRVVLGSVKVDSVG